MASKAKVGGRKDNKQVLRGDGNQSVECFI